MNDGAKEVKIPAVGMIIAAVLNLCLGALTLISGLMRLIGAMGKEDRIRDDAERIGYYFGTAIGYGSGLLSVVFAPIIIYGALRMMSGKNRGLAKAAAILSLLPVTCCSFPLGMLFGIWTLFVLRDEDVIAYFNGEQQPQHFMPPQPPNWQ